jgi:hypothetical protein
MKTFFTTIAAVLLTSALASAQKSPAMTATGTIAGKTLSIKYGAPSVRGRQIFGDGGRISQDPNYPVWRAGADPATLFHTDANLQIGDLSVPKGDYSFYVLVKDPDAWQLIINKQVGQWGLEYDPAQDLGRVPMTMTKPAALIEQLKYVISSDGPKSGKIQIEWEHHIATVTVSARPCRYFLNRSRKRSPF